jgi:hypothetical protein
MKKLILIIFTLLFTTISFSQKRENKIFEASKGKWEIPIKKYIQIEYYKTLEHICDAHVDSTLKIFADSAYDVKAMHQGKVTLISTVDSLQFFLLLKFGDYFIVYNSLDKIYVKQNEEIRKGQLIGKIGKDLDGIFNLEISLQKRHKDICPKNWINWKTK